MDLPAPTQSITSPSTLVERIFFGSLEFTPHTPAQRLVFGSFHEGLDLAFGSMHFHINTVGTVRLPDAIYADPTELTASSSTSVTANEPAPVTAAASSTPSATLAVSVR